MTTALGLGLLGLGSLIVWGAVTNRSPVGMVRAGFSGGDFASVGPIG